MPRDRLAFAVGVRCEEDVGRGFDGALKLFDHVALAFNGKVARREIVLHVDAERGFREVAHVSDRGLHDITGRQELLNRARFRR
jgi:hypothetical protein